MIQYLIFQEFSFLHSLNADSTTVFQWSVFHDWDTRTCTSSKKEEDNKELLENLRVKASLDIRMSNYMKPALF